MVYQYHLGVTGYVRTRDVLTVCYLVDYCWMVERYQLSSEAWFVTVDSIVVLPNY